MFVFSLGNKESFENLEKWIAYLEKDLGIQDKMMLLVGHQNDTETDRKVSKFDIKELVRDLGCDYVETSCLDRIVDEKDTVNEAFDKIILKAEGLIEARNSAPTGALNIKDINFKER